MNKGASLYLAVLVMIVLVSIALGLSTILFTQIKIIREMEYSVIAFSAADTGIEKVLCAGENATDTVDYSGSLDNNATYTPQVIDPGQGNCPAGTTNFCINSRGAYRQTQRAIQITR